ncbi:MAG TPA: hypothetical protein VLX92_28710 [Kofleriaceae bacterium]|nr:hypothetical protein [Kofleriaceae bacterium]
MARSDHALHRARAAYERAHVASALRGVAIAVAITLVALALHRTTGRVTWLLAATLGATLATLGWRGGAWRRGALAGVLAGLPPLVAPAVMFALGHGGQCPSCAIGPTLPCLITCAGTSALVGALVGYAATRDGSPARFALAAIASAALTGLLGCTTTGLGGAIGVVVGLAAGGVTGWAVAGRLAQAAR